MQLLTGQWKILQEETKIGYKQFCPYVKKTILSKRKTPGKANWGLFIYPQKLKVNHYSLQVQIQLNFLLANKNLNLLLWASQHGQLSFQVASVDRL